MPDASAPPFHIALCCNGTMLPGLHATLGSLVKLLSRREKVSLTVFVQDVLPAEIEALHGTVADSGGVGAVNFCEADTSQLRDLKTLHGEWMVYLRLLLPRLLPEAQTILYLDSDMVIATDACAFFDIDMRGAALGAIDGASVAWMLDKDFLKLVGLNDDDRAFNSGVVLFNAVEWQKNSYVDKALEMARTHSDVLTSHDQSVLNAMFSRTFYKLPKQFNHGIAPEDAPLPTMDAIIHFVGSPKPWDPFGKRLHGNWEIWNRAISETRFRWNDFLAHHFSAYWRRAWTLRRSYVRTLQKK